MFQNSIGCETKAYSKINVFFDKKNLLTCILYTPYHENDTSEVNGSGGALYTINNKWLGGWTHLLF